MPNRQKQKGNRFERQCVEFAQHNGFQAERAWGSDGRALGFTEDVDVVITTPLKSQIKAQCKAKKKIAEYIKPTENVDVQLLKEDRGKIYAVITFEEYLELLRWTDIGKEAEEEKWHFAKMQNHDRSM